MLVAIGALRVKDLYTWMERAKGEQSFFKLNKSYFTFTEENRRETTRLPREINKKFLETASQEFVVPCSFAACHLVDHQARERMNRRVYITQSELISW